VDLGLSGRAAIVTGGSAGIGRAIAIDFLIIQQSDRKSYESLYSLYRHVILKGPVAQKNMIQVDIIKKNIGHLNRIISEYFQGEHLIFLFQQEA